MSLSSSSWGKELDRRDSSEEGGIQVEKKMLNGGKKVPGVCLLKPRNRALGATDPQRFKVMGSAGIPQRSPSSKCVRAGETPLNTTAIASGVCVCDVSLTRIKEHCAILFTPQVLGRPAL
jgi:hypothetical protein